MRLDCLALCAALLFLGGCPSSDDGSVDSGGSSPAGYDSGRRDVQSGVGPSGTLDAGMGTVVKENHCVISTGRDAYYKPRAATGPGSSTGYGPGVDASYIGGTSGFYCDSSVYSLYSFSIQVSVTGRLDEMLPYKADEGTSNYRNVAISYSEVPGLFSSDLSKTQWWSCHGGMDITSGNVAKGSVGKFSVAIDSAAPQSYVGENPYKYLLGGTVHAECPPFTPNPSSGVPGVGTVTIDVTFD
jgi:hypothetical protein